MSGSPSTFSNTATFASANQFNNNLTAFLDIFGITRDSKEDYYNEIQNAMSSLNADAEGKITLSNGMEVDMSKISGMTVFTTHMQFVQAHMEMIDNVYGFIKTLENKLDNLLSS